VKKRSSAGFGNLKTAITEAAAGLFGTDPQPITVLAAYLSGSIKMKSRKERK
jgi:hypothetical protein